MSYSSEIIIKQCRSCMIEYENSNLLDLFMNNTMRELFEKYTTLHVSSFFIISNVKIYFAYTICEILNYFRLRKMMGFRLTSVKSVTIVSIMYMIL